MFLPDFVCLSVSQQDNSKSYGRIFAKFWGHLGNGKNYQWFNFGDDSKGILDSGSLKIFRYHCFQWGTRETAAKPKMVLPPSEQHCFGSGVRALTVFHFFMRRKWRYTKSVLIDWFVAYRPAINCRRWSGLRCSWWRRVMSSISRLNWLRFCSNDWGVNGRLSDDAWSLDAWCSSEIIVWHTLKRWNIETTSMLQNDVWNCASFSIQI